LLAGHGFKTIVNLREKHVDQPPAALAAQFNLLQFPVRNHGAPTMEQALRWLDICADEGQRPIYVHCEHGVGRTSTFYALVRLAQGDPVDNVIAEEIETYEFPPEAREQIAFIRNFSERLDAGDLRVPKLSTGQPPANQ